MAFKIKQYHKRDFWIYVKFSRKFRKFNPFPSPLFKRGNLNTLKSFVMFDGAGKITEPKHPRLLKEAIDGKSKLNFQIKLWADGLFDNLELCNNKANGLVFANIEFYDIKNEYSWLPDWVWTSLWNQFISKYKEII